MTPWICVGKDEAGSETILTPFARADHGVMAGAQPEVAYARLDAGRLRRRRHLFRV